MQIGRFKAFDNGLATHFRPPAPIVRSEIYRASDDKWVDSKNQPVVDPHTINYLTTTAQNKSHWRNQKSIFSWYWINDLRSVVKIESPSPIRSATRASLNQAILQCYKHSMDSHDASHDGLTGILNAKAIEECLLESLIPVDGATSDAGDAIQQQSQQKSTALLSFDLDHFKQINDSHGHDYGDIVLMTFARRIETALEEIQTKHVGLSLKFGRAGGEEFSVVASGKITEDLIDEVANELRIQISDKPLPDEVEWNKLPVEAKNTSISLPHLSDRKVTASIGVSSVVTPIPGDSHRKLAERLRHEADAALYRAKAGGRNVVRYFPTIRDKYGAVLEHHIDTGIVSIDIGKDVDVRIGHEFSVFHPDFTGDKYFVRSDGRSKKTLGIYPRISCGRLVVFNSQRDIAFCYVENKKCVQLFPVGSALQFIPAGSITHLISEGIDGGSSNSSRMIAAKEFEDSVKTLAPTTTDFGVATLVLLNASTLEKSSGVSMTNKALADLFRAIEASVPVTSKISQISAFDISFSIFGYNAEDLKGIVESIISEAESRSAGHGIFGAGIFHPGFLGSEQMNRQNSLDFSRYAASPLLLVESSKIGFFGDSTGETLLHKLRSTHRQSDGQQDYARLTRLGIESANIHNQGALCYLEASTPDLDEALVAICKALDLQWLPIYSANKAIIQYALGDIEGSDASFVEIVERNSGFDLPEVYRPARSMAAYAAHEKGRGRYAVSELIELLEEAKGIPLLSTIPIKIEEILNAIDTLKLIKPVATSA